MLSRSEELLITLIEHTVFSTEYDEVLQTHVKNRRDVENMFSSAPLHSLVTDIDEALRGEAQPAGAGVADGADKDQDMDEDQHGGGAPADDETLPVRSPNSPTPKPRAPSDTESDASGMVADVPRRTATWTLTQSDVRDVTSTCVNVSSVTWSSSSTGTGGFAPVAAVIKKAKGVLAPLMELIRAGQSYIRQMHRLDFIETTIEPMRAYVAGLSRAYQTIKLLVVMCVDNASAYDIQYKMIEDRLAWYANTKHLYDMMIMKAFAGADDN